jgi:hypothetical protein
MMDAEASENRLVPGLHVVNFPRLREAILQCEDGLPLSVQFRLAQLFVPTWESSKS